MNIFVTGATGVLGKPVVRLLVESGHKVYALSRSEANTATIRQPGLLLTNRYPRLILM
jgi:uncharacterized protein YbjT (DUF2867 family)